jgi:hypothetical protein
LALVQLFGWLKYFREKRQRENLSQADLLKQEAKQIGLAILVIIGLFGFLVLLAWIIMK